MGQGSVGAGAARAEQREWEGNDQNADVLLVATCSANTAIRCPYLCTSDIVSSTNEGLGGRDRARGPGRRGRTYRDHVARVGSVWCGAVGWWVVLVVACCDAFDLKKSEDHAGAPIVVSTEAGGQAREKTSKSEKKSRAASGTLAQVAVSLSLRSVGAPKDAPPPVRRCPKQQSSSAARPRKDGKGKRGKKRSDHVPCHRARSSAQARVRVDRMLLKPGPGWQGQQEVAGWRRAAWRAAPGAASSAHFFLFSAPRKTAE